MLYLRQVCLSSADAEADDHGHQGSELPSKVLQVLLWLVPRALGMCHIAASSAVGPQDCHPHLGLEEMQIFKTVRVAPRNICVCLSEVFSFCLGVL